ncbi:MAG TPA: DUF3343 domain-containing protein [Candidatus Cloacimonadota bacterium]|nr:DUF3343 domain-containing protein [Candidatus Cloacimonadota bacterium]
MDKLKKSVILFHSTNYAIWAQNELQANGLPCKMISVPRQLSSDCGYCVQMETQDKPKAEQFLIAANIEFDRIDDL